MNSARLRTLLPTTLPLARQISPIPPPFPLIIATNGRLGTRRRRQDFRDHLRLGRFARGVEAVFDAPCGPGPLCQVSAPVVGDYLVVDFIP